MASPSGDVAQLEEHLLCKQGVAGSSPVVSTTKCLVTALKPCRVDLVRGVPGVRVPLPCHKRQRTPLTSGQRPSGSIPSTATWTCELGRVRVRCSARRQMRRRSPEGLSTALAWRARRRDLGHTPGGSARRHDRSQLARAAGFRSPDGGQPRQGRGRRWIHVLRPRRRGFGSVDGCDSGRCGRDVVRHVDWRTHDCRKRCCEPARLAAIPRSGRWREPTCRDACTT
jgi:hypothetical protein